MTELFLKLLNMSITASWIVPAVLVLRLIFRKTKVPTFVSCLLWVLVGIRLVFPFSFESVISLIPSAQTVSGDILTGNSFSITTGFERIDVPLGDYLDSHYYEGVTVPANAGFDLMRFFCVIWLCGIAAMLLYTVISYIRLYRRVRVSVKSEDNIYLCDAIDTPFILGVFRPRIYLPSGMCDQAAAYVIAHEKAHLSRYDHLIKPFAFLLLSVYWFNPVLWVAYLFLCRDIELACDEKVIKAMGPEDKKAYSEALLSCSIQNTLPRRLISACPLAFGEVGVKKRIVSVLNYKKPAFWVVVSALILSAVLSICFLTDPPGMGIDDIEPLGNNIFKNISRVTVIVEEHRHVSDNEPKNRSIIRKLKRVRLEQLDHSRDESRNRDIEVKLLPGDTTIYLNADCTELWLDDGVKPSVTYRIKNPEVLTKNGMFYEYEPKGIGDTAITVPSFAIEDRGWKMICILNNADGSVLACHPSHSEAYPEAKTIHMILGADGEILTLTDQTNQKTYDLIYSQISIDPESWLYEVESKQTGGSGHATVAFTKYDDGSKVYNMVLSIGEYSIYFEENSDTTVIGSAEQVDRIEVYYMDQPVLYDNPTLRLNLSDETFTFNYSTFSSYLAYGHFEVKDDKLICTTDDGNNAYQFDILGYASYNAFTGLRFDAEHSSKIPSYRYSSDAAESICPVTDGAKFIYTEDAVMVTPADQLLAEIQCDIDGDGAKEQCSLTLGLSQTSAWVPVTLTVSKILDSYTYEVIYKETLRMGGTYVTMEENKDGYLSIYVWDKPLDDPDRAVYSVYDIFLQDGKFTIRQAISEPLKQE